MLVPLVSARMSQATRLPDGALASALATVLLPSAPQRHEALLREPASAHTPRPPRPQRPDESYAPGASGELRVPGRKA